MKRKLVSILCVATMLIAMTACGRSDVQGTVTSTKDSGASSTTTVSTVVSTETSTEVSTELSTETSTEVSTELSTETSVVIDTSASTETVVEEPNDDSAIKPGTVTFNEYEKSSVYENKYFGIGAVFDSSWSAWDAQWCLYAEPNPDLRYNYAEGDYRDLSKEDYAMLLEVFSGMRELRAGRADGSDGFEEIGVNISVCTDEELNATEAQLIESAMSQTAIAHALMNVNVEYRDITFAGAEHRGTYLTYPSGGGTNYEVTMIIKKGKYLYNIYIQSSNADDLESYINMFYEVK